MSAAAVSLIRWGPVKPCVRRTVGQRRMPQVLPVAQEDAPESRRAPLPATLAAKAETCFTTCLLPQVGHSTSTGCAVLRMSFSNLSLQSVQAYS